MLRDRSSRAKEVDRASEERLLAQEGVVWTLDEETNSCGSFTKTFLRFFAISIFFMSGALFGFFWRGDLDGLCSRHISQQCELLYVGSSFKCLAVTNPRVSAYFQRSGYRV